MPTLNRNNSNWSLEERRKINENWDILENATNSAANSNNGLRQEVDELKVTIGQNTTMSRNAVQTANQAKQTADGIDGKATEALETAQTANGKSNTAIQTANTAKQVAEGIDGKVMEAMTTAEVAETKSDNAIDIANDAKTTSETVQEQFNQVVAEAGSNNPEVVASRTDVETGESFVNLSQRLDQQHKRVTSQLEQVTLNPADFKQPQDLDDTQSLELILLYVAANNIKSFKLPYKQSYRVRRILNITTDDLEIDLNGSTIEWIGTAVINTGIDRNNGVFRAHGALSGSPTPITNFQSVEYVNRSIIPAPNHLGHTNRCSYVTVTDPSGYTKGDYVLLRVGNSEDSSNADYENVFNPWFEYLVRIIEIDGNNIYLNYYSPFDYSGFDLSTFATITKVTPRKNITIKNGTINDTTPYANNEAQTNPDRNKLASGIALRYAVGCKVEDITGNGMKFPLVIGSYTYDTEIKNIINYNVLSHGSGEGYGVHLIFGLYARVKNVVHQGGNSALDFSACAYSTADNVKCRSVYGGKTIGTHGMTEHDLFYNDCEGHFAFNNGIATFTGIGANITLNRCKGSMFSSAGSYLTIVMNECELNFSRSNGRDNHITELVANDTTLILDPVTWFLASKRPGQPKTKFVLNRGKIILRNGNAGPIRNAIRGFDEVNISSTIDYTDAAGTALAFYNNVSMNVTGKLINTLLYIYYTEGPPANASINFNGAEFIADGRYNAQYDMVRFMTVENVNLITNVLGCTVTNLSNQSIFLHRTDNMSTKTSSNITLNLLSNVLANIGTGRLYYYGENTSNATSRIIKNTVNNSIIDSRYMINVDLLLNKVSDSDSRIGGTARLNRTTNFTLPSNIGKGVVGYNDNLDRFWLSTATSWKEINFIDFGTTAQRPTNASIGAPYFDTTLGKPVWFKATNNWVDATGITV